MSPEHSTGLRDRVDGRLLGTQGRERRQLILDTLHRLLLSTPWREVKIVEIARDAGCSPALFWCYFGSIEEAFDVLCQQLTQDDKPLPAHFEIIRELVDFERHSLNAEAAV